MLNAAAILLFSNDKVSKRWDGYAYVLGDLDEMFAL